MNRLAAGVAVVALLPAACSGFIDHQAAKSTLKILQASSQAALRLPDVEMARDALPGGILQLEAFAIAYPDQREFRELHAQALCQYATAFVFDDWEDATFGGRDAEAEHLEQRLQPLLDACVDAQLALLPPAWRTARERGNPEVIALLATATRAQAPGMLAIATADASRLAMSPFAHLGDLPRIRAMLERSIVLAPGLDDARGELLLGSIAAGSSALLGGEDGTRYFAAARKLAGPQHLLTDVLFARGIAVAHGDRAGFEATLNTVLAADPARWPDHRLANELAQRKARRYLTAAPLLFPEPPEAEEGSDAGSASGSGP